jgi:hypothetical protein
MRKTVQALLILYMVPAFALAQQASDPWNNLKKLATGQPIHVVSNDGKSYSGHFQSVRDDGLVFRVGGEEQTLGRQDILRVSTVSASHRTRNALIGAAIGVGGGLAIAAGCNASYNSQGYTQNRCMEVIAPTGAAVGGGVGAGIGALVSKSGWHDVYRAR